MKIPLYSIKNQQSSNYLFDCFGMDKKKGSFMRDENQLTSTISHLFHELEIIFANIRV